MNHGRNKCAHFICILLSKIAITFYFKFQRKQIWTNFLLVYQKLCPVSFVRWDKKFIQIWNVWHSTFHWDCFCILYSTFLIRHNQMILIYENLLNLIAASLFKCALLDSSVWKMSKDISFWKLRLVRPLFIMSSLNFVL